MVDGEVDPVVVPLTDEPIVNLTDHDEVRDPRGSNNGLRQQTQVETSS